MAANALEPATPPRAALVVLGALALGLAVFWAGWASVEREGFYADGAHLFVLQLSRLADGERLPFFDDPVYSRTATNALHQLPSALAHAAGVTDKTTLGLIFQLPLFFAPLLLTLLAAWMAWRTGAPLVALACLGSYATAVLPFQVFSVNTALAAVCAYWIPVAFLVGRGPRGWEWIVWAAGLLYLPWSHETALPFGLLLFFAALHHADADASDRRAVVAKRMIGAMGLVAAARVYGQRLLDSGAEQAGYFTELRDAWAHFPPWTGKALVTLVLAAGLAAAWGWWRWRPPGARAAWGLGIAMAVLLLGVLPGWLWSRADGANPFLDWRQRAMVTLLFLAWATWALVWGRWEDATVPAAPRFAWRRWALALVLMAIICQIVGQLRLTAGWRRERTEIAEALAAADRAGRGMLPMQGPSRPAALTTYGKPHLYYLWDWSAPQLSVALAPGRAVPTVLSPAPKYARRLHPSGRDRLAVPYTELKRETPFWDLGPAMDRWPADM